MNEELNSYVTTLIEDTHLKMDEFSTPEMAFTAAVLEKIEDLLDCKEIAIEHCKITNTAGKVLGEIHAYAESTNGEVLYLFYTDYNPRNEVQVKSNSASQPSLTRPQGFYNAAIRCAHVDMEPDSAEYKACKYIYDNVQQFMSVNLVVLSNYVINKLQLSRIRLANKPVFFDVWDLKKI